MRVQRRKDGRPNRVYKGPNESIWRWSLEGFVVGQGAWEEEGKGQGRGFVLDVGVESAQWLEAEP